jgi:hypothetical protein
MIGWTILYRVGDAPREVMLCDNNPDLSVLQKAVGGYIEAVPYWHTVEVAGEVMPCVAYCNEEGKLQRLPANGSATHAWDAALQRDHRVGVSDILVGDVIVVAGDKAFMRRHCQ